VLDCPKQIDERSAYPVDRPGHHDVELPPARIVEYLVEAWTLFSVFGTADARVAVDLYDFPPSALGDLAELYLLVLDRLAVSADP
jgi:hypothetical protein